MKVLSSLALVLSLSILISCKSSGPTSPTGNDGQSRDPFSLGGGDPNATLGGGLNPLLGPLGQDISASGGNGIVGGSTTTTGLGFFDRSRAAGSSVGDPALPGNPMGFTPNDIDEASFAKFNVDAAYDLVSRYAIDTTAPLKSVISESLIDGGDPDALLERSINLYGARSNPAPGMNLCRLYESTSQTAEMVSAAEASQCLMRAAVIGGDQLKGYEIRLSSPTLSQEQIRDILVPDAQVTKMARLEIDYREEDLPSEYKLADTTLSTGGVGPRPLKWSSVTKVLPRVNSTAPIDYEVHQCARSNIPNIWSTRTKLSNRLSPKSSGNYELTKDATFFDMSNVQSNVRTSEQDPYPVARSSARLTLNAELTPTRSGALVFAANKPRDLTGSQWITRFESVGPRSAADVSSQREAYVMTATTYFHINVPAEGGVIDLRSRYLLCRMPSGSVEPCPIPTTGSGTTNQVLNSFAGDYRVTLQQSNTLPLLNLSFKDFGLKSSLTGNLPKALGVNNLTQRLDRNIRLLPGSHLGADARYAQSSVPSEGATIGELLETDSFLRTDRISTPHSLRQQIEPLEGSGGPTDLCNANSPQIPLITIQIRKKAMSSEASQTPGYDPLRACIPPPKDRGNRAPCSHLSISSGVTCTGEGLTQNCSTTQSSDPRSAASLETFALGEGTLIQNRREMTAPAAAE